MELVFKGDNSFKNLELKDHLPQNDCRFVIYNFDYETNENPPRKVNKIILFNWIPVVAPIRNRIPFTSTKSSFARSFIGIQKELNVFDWSDLDYQNIRKELI